MGTQLEREGSVHGTDASECFLALQKRTKQQRHRLQNKTKPVGWASSRIPGLWDCESMGEGLLRDLNSAEMRAGTLMRFSLPLCDLHLTALSQ